MLGRKTRRAAQHRRHRIRCIAAAPLLCQRNRPGVLPADLDIPYNPFPPKRSGQEPRRRLSSDQLKTILRACYEEIDEVWGRFQYGQEIIRLPDLPLRGNTREALPAWVCRISRTDGGAMPHS